LTWNITENLVSINYDELNIDCELKNQKVYRPFDYMLSIIHPSDKETMNSACNDLYCGNEDKMDIDVRTNYLNENYEWYSVKAWVNEKDEDGKALTVTGITINISKRKQFERSLIEAKEKAEEANRLKSAFLASISHEIRTPLNAIVGFSRILTITELSNEQKNEFADIIEHNNSLLLRIINDLISLAKIDAGTLELEYSEVDINVFLSEIVQSSKYMVEQKQIKILFISELQECIINVEKSWITQILNNLISNAIKFTQQGDITLKYQLKDSQIYFYVKDTGEGIPKDKQDVIFDRFSKLDSFKQGTGLGLALCSSIVHKLGGDIGVESEVGKGSTFWFTLPYTSVSDAFSSENNEFVHKKSYFNAGSQ